MAKDAKGHGSDAKGGSGFVQGLQPMTPDQQKTLLGRENPLGAAHQTAVGAVGQQPMTPPPESSASRELRLFADNDSDLHRQSETPIRQNLGQKMDKGVYDPNKAQTLWKYHADRAAESYGKQMGGNGKQMFSPGVRREAAQHWESETRGSLKSGEYGNPYPSHQTNLRAAWDKKHGS